MKYSILIAHWFLRGPSSVHEPGNPDLPFVHCLRDAFSANSMESQVLVVHSRAVSAERKIASMPVACGTLGSYGFGPE